MDKISLPEQSGAIKMEVERIFSLQKANQQKIANTSASERIKKLDRLSETILKHRTEIQEALYQDFRKHRCEVDLAEIYTVISDIKYAKRHLKKWMRPQKVGTPLILFGASSYIQYEPKGVVLIISPWNFPVTLTFGPLISAIAAGNCVVVKPSELTLNASAIMKKIIAGLFDESEIALLEGDVTLATELLKLPFNHIFFTGSPEIGKVVMKAAAENLASVTLELGGKSPAIVDETANLKIAAQRITFNKWFNNGQICFAPDHVFVHQSVAKEFLNQLKTSIYLFYGDNPATSESYNRIVNHRHFNRLNSYFEEAIDKGATVTHGGISDPSQEYFSPTIVTNVPENCDLSKKEIFGPILPFITYTDLQEVIGKISAGEKPLVMYIFSKNRKNINLIIKNTRAGATVINNVGIHFFNNSLPFGGSNNSGIGKGNGFFGFEEFSNPRAIVKQWFPVNSLDLIKAPYNSKKQKLIDMTVKWF